MNRAKCFIAVTLSCLLAFAQTPASTRAMTLVEQALAFAKQNGMTRLIEETNSPHGRFHVAKGDELYIFIYDERGLTKASRYRAEMPAGKSRVGPARSRWRDDPSEAAQGRKESREGLG